MAATLHSMTGYGTGRAPLDGGEVVIEARTVNHRFFDVRTRLPPALAEHAAAIEEILRRRLVRGRAEIVARVAESTEDVVHLDRSRARAAFKQLLELRDELGPRESVPLSLLSVVPNLFLSHRMPDSEHVAEAIRVATEAACDAVLAMRAREGEALGAALDAQLAEVDRCLRELGARVGQLVDDYRRKLRNRVQELLADTDKELDEGRLEHEVALLADRTDVTEELTRLAAHVEAFREAMGRAAGPVGRRLDFLLQEMARESNTIGAKSCDVRTTHIVVDLKAAIERMREQGQNVL